jgi:predicted MPP superfamily phosphohydrolase
MAESVPARAARRRTSLSFPGKALTVLALLHLYIGLRLLSPWPPAGIVLGAAALAALYLVLPAGFSRGGRRSNPAWRWAGLIGMGFFSSLLVLTVLRDALLLLAGVLAAVFGLHFAAGLRADTSLAVPLLAFAASAIGFFNARRRPAVREVAVPIAGLPPALHGFTVVQLSDLHVGPTIGRRFVQKVVDGANALAPDLVVITGDIVDGQVAELSERVAPLAQLRARHGAFGVTGNHEYYSGAPAWVDAFERLGLRMLMNAHVVVEHDGARLVLAGVTDYAAQHFDRGQRSDPPRSLEGAPADAPKLLLAHQPRSAPAAAAAGFDLQLSGHTHGGQFLPWNWFVPLQQPYTAGLHRHAGSKLWVYISRGTGYWGPPKRLGAPSEITRLRLVGAAS